MLHEKKSNDGQLHRHELTAKIIAEILSVCWVTWLSSMHYSRLIRPKYKQRQLSDELCSFSPVLTSDSCFENYRTRCMKNIL
jgi:hypothetical protein